MDKDFEILRDSILYVFKKKSTAFLTTESILKEIHFQKGIFPKEDRERLEGLLETMREMDLITLNQPRFAALAPAGQKAMECLGPGRILQIEKDIQERRGG